MQAMVLNERGAGRVDAVDRPLPEPGAGQLLIQIRACGVCRTDLHLVDGDLPYGPVPIVPGHEIVGVVAACGAGVTGFQAGDRVGVPWLGWSCGECAFCRQGRENLCPRARYTGLHLDGGYAQYTVADARYCLHLPPAFDDVHCAPLLCAGLIGYRAYRMAGEAEVIGLYGFGAAAHIIVQLAVAEGKRVFAFTRPDDDTARKLALRLGAAWAGSSREAPPTEMQAAILFAPAGELVPIALKCITPGGSVVCAGIHMSDIPAFPYRLLWQERMVRSVANLTRRDGQEFFAAIANLRLHTEVHSYPLLSANEALDDLRHGRFAGAAVLIPPQGQR